MTRETVVRVGVPLGVLVGHALGRIKTESAIVALLAYVAAFVAGERR